MRSGIGLRQRPAAGGDGARRRGKEAGEHHEQRGLAAPGRADDGDEAARLDVEFDVLQRRRLAVGGDVDVAEARDGDGALFALGGVECG